MSSDPKNTPEKMDECRRRIEECQQHIEETDRKIATALESLTSDERKAGPGNPPEAK